MHKNLSINNWKSKTPFCLISAKSFSAMEKGKSKNSRLAEWLIFNFQISR